jgi:hypothetical protein
MRRGALLLVGLVILGLLWGLVLGYLLWDDSSLHPPKAKTVTVEKTVPGPERIVEQTVERTVPGPERTVEKTVKEPCVLPDTGPSEEVKK